MASAALRLLVVVMFHYFYFGPITNQHLSIVKNIYAHLEQVIALGWSGVDLFFVLSGFLIGGILINVKESRNYFKTFYFRRFFRIIPIYYIWILSYLVIATVAGSYVTGSELSEHKSQVVPLIFFLQNCVTMNYSLLAAAWFLPTWSLAVEEQFYLVCPLVIRFFIQARSIHIPRARYISCPISSLMDSLPLSSPTE